MVSTSAPVVILLSAVTLVALIGSAWSLPGPAWPHQAQHQHQSPLAQTPPLQELDPVDKCLFTCDYCYKQTKVLLACANECIANAGETSMGRVWLETCPFFGQPIYFDYQPV